MWAFGRDKREMKHNPDTFILLYLIFFGTWRKHVPLCIKTPELLADTLHLSIQVPVFIILCTEVILVTLALLV